MKFLTPDSALHRIARCTLATALLLAPSLVAKAQDLDTVTITGRVMDQNSAVIPGASVSATLTKTGLARTTTSDGEGHYRVIQRERWSAALSPPKKSSRFPFLLVLHSI